VHPAPPQCPCCGGPLRKLGEDITETLEYVPARFKVIQHVRGVGAIAGGVIGYKGTGHFAHLGFEGPPPPPLFEDAPLVLP